MRRYTVGIFLTALVSLMIELLLTRVYEVIIASNISYLVITCAMFAIGGAGVYRTLKPMPDDPATVDRALSLYAVIVAVAILLLRPLSDYSGFDLIQFPKAPIRQGLWFLLIYLSMVVPFFFLGMIFVTIFSKFSAKIQSLYFWDLAGAGLGCIAFLPFLPYIGAGGLLIASAGLLLVVAALFAVSRQATLGLAIAGVVVVAVPFTLDSTATDFRILWDKRDLAEDTAEGRREFSRWDYVAKIDVVQAPTMIKEGQVEYCCYKHVAYDGGNQSTRLIKLDVTPAELRARYDAGQGNVFDDFWFGGVVASHAFKRDQHQDVLVIGSAGGQEIKAALMYGAGSVEGVEMVKTVIDLAKGEYSSYIGDIMQDPRVKLIHGEGRSYLRATDKKYDIIQIFSNYTSSAAASGGRSTGTSFLVTAEAFEEYFTHLKDDGILHFNYHFYPRLITSAALAWKEMGKTDDFQDHVLVMERTSRAIDPLPTILIKMTPWTAAEVAEVVNTQRSLPKAIPPIDPVVNPADRAGSFLSHDFFTGELPAELAARMPYDVSATTDDRPYYNFVRKSLDLMHEDPAVFLNKSMAGQLNKMMAGGVPFDLIHLILTGVASSFFAVLFVLIPMFFSPAGRAGWSGKGQFLVYFASLGFGFIIFELVLIQIFMRLVGYPLYTYSAVIFTMLLAAGLGSLTSIGWASPRIGAGPSRSSA